MPTLLRKMIGVALAAILVVLLCAYAYRVLLRPLRLAWMEASLETECENAIGADPQLAQQREHFQSVLVFDMPTFFAVKKRVPSCVSYVRALLSDPDRATEERWEIDAISRW